MVEMGCLTHMYHRSVTGESVWELPEGVKLNQGGEHHQKKNVHQEDAPSQQAPAGNKQQDNACLISAVDEAYALVEVRSHGNVANMCVPHLVLQACPHGFPLLSCEKETQHPARQTGLSASSFVTHMVTVADSEEGGRRR
jgi:hypothetical protein